MTVLFVYPALVVLTACGSGSGEQSLAEAAPPPPSPGEVRLHAIGEMADPNDADRRFVDNSLVAPDERERGLAAWTLGKIGREGDIPRLEQVVRDDEDIHVRMNAARAIGDIGGQSALPVLIGLLDHDDAELVAAVINALGSPRHAAACEPLGEIAVDLKRSGRLRELAIDSLIRIGTPQTRPWMERALGDYHNGVRSVAAFGLGKLGDPRSVPALASLADDGSQKVRANAAQALGMIGNGGARAALEKLAEDDDGEVRVTAREALARIR